MSWISRSSAVIVGAAILGLAATGPAFADTASLGRRVVVCAHMMLPYDLGPDGSISMTMPDGTPMSFPTFGMMVTYMQSHPMCS